VAVAVKVVEKAPEVIKLDPSAIVSVELVVGAVIVTLLIVVAVATPSIGVTRVGEVAKTKAPEPVSLVMAAAKLALVGVAKKVATPVPSPDTPVDIGRPVQLVSVPELGVPRIGVTKVGDVANTNAPEPVSSVIADAKLALEGVTKKVPTPVPKPLTPVEMGKPVQLVRVPEPGVPSVGVVNIGEVKVLLVSVCIPVRVVASVIPYPDTVVGVLAI